MHTKKWWITSGLLIGDMIGNGAFFIVYMLIATGVGKAVEWINVVIGVPPFALIVTSWVEDGILVVDAALTLAYVCKTAFGTLKEILK
jgi:hypothetical protein